MELREAVSKTHKTSDQNSTELIGAVDPMPAPSNSTVQQQLSDTTTTSYPPSISNSSENAVTAGPRTLPYLEALLSFIDTHLGPLFSLQSSVLLGSLERIAFEDLWHLFKPGDLLFSVDKGTEQLYRAHYITGGRLRLRNRTNDELESRIRLTRLFFESDSEDEVEKGQYIEGFGKGTYSDFTIDCYSIAFNGRYLGPLDTAKRISYYGGEREVTSLPIYPLRFHKDGEEAVRR
jgi:hypothetical protein